MKKDGTLWVQNSGMSLSFIVGGPSGKYEFCDFINISNTRREYNPLW